MVFVITKHVNDRVFQIINLDFMDNIYLEYDYGLRKYRLQASNSKDVFTLGMLKLPASYFEVEEHFDDILVTIIDLIEEDEYVEIDAILAKIEEKYTEAG